MAVSCKKYAAEFVISIIICIFGWEVIYNLKSVLL